MPIATKPTSIRPTATKTVPHKSGIRITEPEDEEIEETEIEETEIEGEEIEGEGEEEGEDGEEGGSTAKLPVHPLVGSEDQKLYPFVVARGPVEIEGKEFPAIKGNFPRDYSIKSFARLKRKDFATPADFYQFRMGILEKQYGDLEAKRNNALLGRSGMTDEKKLEKMMRRIQELRKTLAAKGVDVSSFTLSDD